MKRKERWILYGKKADFAGIAAQYGIDQVTARIIRNRGIESDEELRQYLHGSYADLADPALLKDAEKAAGLILGAIGREELIAIASDYDNDGVFSAMILKEAIIGLGGRAIIYTPNRVTEGYGLNLRIVEEAHAAGAAMVLTCDNGIAAFAPVQEAKKRGMCVVVTDHHEIPFTEEDGKKTYLLPEADAIVDAWQADCPYPFKGMCGAGVALRLMELAYRLAGKPMTGLDTWLQYAAIATVADVMSLVGENRILVREGLARLHHTGHVGLNALMQACGIAPEGLASYHIGFILGPCFNAAGRLETAEPAFRLLEEKDPEQAAALAEELHGLNDARKEMTREGVEKAKQLVEEAPWREDKVYLVYLPDCHESVAGIIAGRLREAYYRPVLVFTDSATPGIIKASGRSIEAYDMFTELSRFRELFLHFGGHKMAAGLSMAKEHLEELRKGLNVNCILSDTDLQPQVFIDVPMPLSYVSEALVTELSLLEPFGKGNEKPLFARQHLHLLRASRIGRDKNMAKLLVTEDGVCLFDALYFGDGEAFFAFLREEFGEEQLMRALRGQPNSIDIALTYYPQMNEFQGQRRLQIVVQNYCRIPRKRV